MVLEPRNERGPISRKILYSLGMYSRGALKPLEKKNGLVYLTGLASYGC
jgi:hypothetical protein